MTDNQQNYDEQLEQDDYQESNGNNNSNNKQDQQNYDDDVSSQDIWSRSSLLSVKNRFENKEKKVFLCVSETSAPCLSCER